AGARLIGVVDRTVHAVTETELLRQVHGDAAGPVRAPVGAQAVDELAVIVLGEAVGDFLFPVETLAENERAGVHGRPIDQRTSQATGVSTSSVRRADGPVPSKATSTCPRSSSSEGSARAGRRLTPACTAWWPSRLGRPLKSRVR